MEPKIVQVYNQIQAGEIPLKAIRDALRMSQNEFAHKIGVSITTVSRWETGRNAVTLTIPQVKAMENLLHDIGMNFNSLPDDLGPKK
ncbi:MAG: helix-turn-helix transcriptional regulator [Kaiparowitsia implicata GSE-PSE-MK54-09C]|jgi:DNA-binding transcriptional regulator YiaG|nr:helix-turn-helix transcriptional regulator [Kaiparowitsia implicata GSE-PSE-MK54-09C]